MGTIQVDLFLALGGVYQGPGGPDEDRAGGVACGRWQGAYSDDASGETIGAGIECPHALLLGRRTHDIFAGFWPALGEHDPIAAKYKAVPKFVVSRTLTDPA